MPIPIHDKNSRETRNTGELRINLIKSIYKNPTANIIFHGEKLSHKDQVQVMNAPFYHSFSILCWKALLMQ